MAVIILNAGVFYNLSDASTNNFNDSEMFYIFSMDHFSVCCFRRLDEEHGIW